MSKQKMIKKLKNKKGITLIALVITIIVLIILAGVSINLVLGDNGIITKAKDSKKMQTQEKEKEGIQLALADAQIGDNGYQEIDQTNLQKAIDNQFGKNIAIVTENNDGSSIIKFNSDRSYFVQSNGEIVDKFLEITTKQELEKFRDEVNNGNSFSDYCVLLMNNIQVADWTPIGNNENVFRGNFVGQNNNIEININSEENNIGLFSENYGNIYSLNISGTIIGNDFVGGIAGKNYGNIVNCSNSVEVKSNSTSSNPYIGGIVGKSFSGNILNCYNSGNIQNTKFSTGGIAGGTEKTIIKNCYNIGEISGNGQVGGIIGRIIDSNIFNCYNVGKITNIGPAAGGIVGQVASNCYVENCYNLQSINGDANTGGISGSFAGTMENCYNLANVKGNGTTGGIIGNRGSGTIYPLIKNCYHKGDVVGKTEQKPTALEGGIAGGVSADSVKNCKWYSETVNYTIGNLEITDGYTENLEMANVLEIVNRENKFKEDSDNINQGYPILSWQ